MISLYSSFYLNEKLPEIEQLDFIYQLLTYIDSGLKYNYRINILIFESAPEFKQRIQTLFIKYNPKAGALFSRHFNKINWIQYRKSVLRADFKNMRSASFEFLGPAYFSKLKVKGLFTHIDVLINGNVRPRRGLVYDYVRSRYHLYKGRAKHYKEYKYKKVYFTWAIFLDPSIYNKLIKLYYDHERDLKKLSENQMINRYRYEYYACRSFLSFKSKEYSYQYVGQEYGDAKIIHYDSFFKDNKNNIANIMHKFPKEIQCSIKIQN